MAIAKKIHGFMTQSSFIRKMFEEGIRLKQQYGAENVFDFSLGNPNLDPPEAVKARLLRAGLRRYPREAHVHAECRISGDPGGRCGGG